MLDVVDGEVPTYILSAAVVDLQVTTKWQTKWANKAVQDMPSKNWLIALKGGTDTDKDRMAELEEVDAHGAENGWVAPMTEEDKAFFAYVRSVFKRYNISPSKTTR